MATQVRHPDANGSAINWNPNTGNRVDAVAANDGDTTYISQTVSGQRMSFTFPVFTVGPSDTVNFVTLKGYFRYIGSSAQVRLNVRNESGTISEDADQSAAASYGLITRQLNLNPFTAAAWTPNQVNTDGATSNRLAEIEVRSIAPTTEILCTEFWVEVDYTTSAGVTFAVAICPDYIFRKNDVVPY